VTTIQTLTNERYTADSSNLSSVSLSSLASAEGTLTVFVHFKPGRVRGWK
jgi:hypothetical protein